MTETANTATDTYDAVRAILADELGEEWGDGYTVMDVVSGYAEPGYGSDESVVVMGNWNPKRFPRGDDAPLTHEENVGPRLAERLENVGAELEWYDEWATCGECYRAVRTQGDSYSWKPYYVMGECEFTCADCAREDVDTYLEGYVNNPQNAVTWCGPVELNAAGWEQYAPGDPQQYQNGWHPGQTDNPHDILDGILADDPDAEVIFLLDANSQFYMEFSAWVKVEA